VLGGRREACLHTKVAGCALHGGRRAIGAGQGVGEHAPTRGAAFVLAARSSPHLEQCVESELMNPLEKDPRAQPSPPVLNCIQLRA